MRYIFQLIRDSGKDFILAFLAIISLVVFISFFTYFYFAKDLKTPEGIMNRNNTGVVLLDKNGEIFFKFFDGKYKIFIPLSDIPPRMQQTMINAEDRDFYNHPGFSIKSIIGAIIANFRKGDILYGGSTITQQLVKNTLLNSERSFFRKYQELVLTEEIERKYSKDEILTMYCNSVYFGEGAFGIEEAARTYFGIPAKDLSLAQAAVLASLPTAPSLLSPISGNRKKTIRRQRYILDKMVENGYITEKEAKLAKAEKLNFQEGDKRLFRAPHFALMVKEELIKKYGEEQIARSGFRVYTTIDLKWQDYAQKVVEDQVEKLRFSRVSNGAAVGIDPKTGEIRFVVGSRDWKNEFFGKVNIVTSVRQPGSAFKPIVYIAAMENGLITSASILNDSKITYRNAWESYSPRNYDGKFRGKVSARRALANSLNVPAIEVLSKLGITNAVDMAKRFGITTLKDPSYYGLSLVLGAAEVKPLELTSAYATLANAGKQNKPTTIVKIEDKVGKVVYTHSPENKQVVDEKYAFLISSILSDNKARAEIFGNVLTISRPAAVKTGTTDNYKDSWTIGYTPSLAIGVWIGNNNGGDMEHIAGSIGAAPIWRNLMEKFLEQTPVENFNPSNGIVSKYVCAPYSVRLEYFVKGTEPVKNCFVSPSIFPSVSPSQSLLPFPSPSFSSHGKRGRG